MAGTGEAGFMPAAECAVAKRIRGQGALRRGIRRVIASGCDRMRRSVPMPSMRQASPSLRGTARAAETGAGGAASTMGVGYGRAAGRVGQGDDVGCSPGHRLAGSCLTPMTHITRFPRAASGWCLPQGPAGRWIEPSATVRRPSANAAGDGPGSCSGRPVPWPHAAASWRRGLWPTRHRCHLRLRARRDAAADPPVSTGQRGVG